MKFTEEQYQKFTKLFDEIAHEGNLGLLSHNVVNKFQRSIYEEFSCDFYISNEWPKIAAFANPLTRKWAHEQFVEKEKKYVWQSKNENYIGKVKRLYDTANGISDSFEDKSKPTHNGNLITETEIKKWGYNPEMFDREEV